MAQAFRPLLVPAGRPGYVIDTSGWEDPLRGTNPDADRAHARGDAEAAIVAEVEGDPPRISSTNGLGPRRARLAHYVAWRKQLADELAEIEATKSRLEATIAAPEQVQGKISSAVRATAAALLRRAVAAEDGAERGALENELATARHRADAARIALQEMDEPIKRAKLRLARLTERESEFLYPGLAELADEAGLGIRYRRAIAELRKVVDALNGLAQVAGGFGSGFEIPVTIKLPRMTAIPSMGSSADPEEFLIRAPSLSTQMWRDAAEALLRDPHCKAAKLIALT